MLDRDHVAPELGVLQKTVVGRRRAGRGQSDGAGYLELAQKRPEMEAHRLRSAQ